MLQLRHAAARTVVSGVPSPPPRPGDDGTRRDVEDEVVAGRHERDAHPEWPEQEERPDPPSAHRDRDGDADDQCVSGMDARHRCVGIREEPDQARPLVHYLGVGERVDETAAGNEPGRGCRKHEVADQTYRVGDDQRIPQPQIPIVPPHVYPEQPGRNDHVLRDPVRPVCDMDEHLSAASSRRCRKSSGESAEVPLESDPALTVPQCFRGPACGEPTHSRVGRGEARPDQQLPDEVAPAPRKRAIERPTRLKIEGLGNLGVDVRTLEAVLVREPSGRSESAPRISDRTKDKAAHRDDHPQHRIGGGCNGEQHKDPESRRHHRGHRAPSGLTPEAGAPERSVSVLDGDLDRRGEGDRLTSDAFARPEPWATS